MAFKLAQILPRFRGRNGWGVHDWSGAALLVLISVWITADAWSDIMHRAMTDEESSHAMLVPLVAGWLLWVRLGRFRHCKPGPTWIGPAIVAIGAALYVAGDTYLVELFWHGGALLVAVGCCLTMLGRDVLRNFLPVFISLAFILPIPARVRQGVAIPLQRTTAQATQEVCRLAGLSVDRSGNMLQLNGVDVAIGEACNGMRMTFALLLVCFAFALTAPLHGYVRVIIIVLSPLSAVLCNVVRLVPTVWVFGNCSLTTAEMFHDVSGWVMLFVAFLLLMGIVRLLRWAMLPVTPFTLAYD
jgi:exosortase